MADDHKRVTGRLIRAARALAGLTIAELAQRSTVGVRTIKRWETMEDEQLRVSPANLARVLHVLESANVAVCHDGGGVRLINLTGQPAAEPSKLKTVE